MNTNLEELDGKRPLWAKYHGQTAQEAFVEIDIHGDVFYGVNPEIGNAVPMSVYYGRDLRIAIPNNLTAIGYRQLHEAIKHQLAIVISGMSERWNGNNWVGSLADDAQDVLEDLQHQSYQGEWDGFDSDENEEVES